MPRKALKLSGRQRPKKSNATTLPDRSAQLLKGTKVDVSTSLPCGAHHISQELIAKPDILVAKKPKVEPQVKTLAPPAKTVVKVASKKTDGVDMSAFGLTAPQPKVRRTAAPQKVDAISSLLSGLNPTMMNGQSNAKMSQSTSVDVKPIRASGKPRKSVRWEPEGQLVKIKWIENRESDEYDVSSHSQCRKRIELSIPS